LARINQQIPGRLEVGTLERLDPRGLGLSDVRLLDPQRNVVLELGRLGVALEPLALLRGKIVLTRAALDRVRVDLRDIDAPDRGLVAALVVPAVPEPHGEAAAPPYVRVDEIVVSGLDVEAPELAPPWRALRVEGLNATARFELDGAPEVRLTSLDCDVTRGGRPLARVEHVAGVLARPAAASQLSLVVASGAVRASLSGRGVLPPAPEHANAPLGAELQLEGLTAHELGVLLDDATLDAAFRGPLALRITASGTLAELVLQGGLETAAGRLDLNGSLRERRRVALRATTTDLVLSRLRPELPPEPLSLALEAETDIDDATRLPITLRATPGRYGAFALPALDARASWTGESVRDLSVSLEQGQSRVSVRGNVDRAGSLDVHVGASVAAAELRALAISAGVRAAPRAALSSDLRLERSALGALSIRGDVRAEGVRLPQLSLDAARVDVALEGPPDALEGRADVRLRGLTQGSLRVPRADFALTGRRGEYRASGSADIDRSSIAFELRGRPQPDRWTLDGNVRGRWEETPFALRVGQTTISPRGWAETRGIDVDAGEQRLHVAGGVGRPRSELVVSAPSLELGRLARLAGLADAWRGKASLEARLRGEPAAPVIHLQLRAEDVARGVAPPVFARIDAQLDAQAGRASLDVALGSGAAASWVDAAFALESEFRPGAGWERELDAARQKATLELREIDLHALGRWIGRPIPVSARVGLSAALEGTLRQPVLHARLHAALAQGLGLPSLRLEQRLDYAQGALSAALDVDDAAGRWLSLGTELELPADSTDLLALAPRLGAIGDRARWSVRLAAARRRVGALWTDAPAAIANVELDSRAELSHEPGAEPAGSASVYVREARLPSSPASCVEAGAELALEAKLANRELEAALTATQRRTQLLAATARATLELSPALRGGAATFGTIAGQLTSRGLDLEKVPYLCGRVRGRLDAKVTLADPLGAEPTLEAQLTATGLSLGAEPSLGVELTAHAEHGAADANVRVTGPRGTSSLSARVPIQWSSGRFALATDAALSGHARLVALPIAPLLDPAGAVSYATGWLSGSVDVGGTLGEPEPSGTLELEDAELTATALAQPLHGVRGRVAFDRRALVIERFEALDRDGKLALSGRVDRRGPGSLDVTLDLVAEQFPLRQRGQIVATTSGHAQVHAGIEPARTTVAVKLVDADTWLEKAQARTGIDLAAHPDFVIAGAAAARGSKGAAPTEGGDGSAALASADDGGAARESRVRFDASDRFWIKRDDFAIQLSTQLDAVITGEQAKVTGKVDINRGYFDLMGRVFDVERGSRLEFIGSSKPDPVVDISATYEHRSSGKTVKVQISGRASKPVLTFFIDEGEVSAGEVLELLLGGRGSGGDESARKEATSFVSALTAGLLATSARRELGAAAPIIMIEPGEQTGDGRIRAGFELDALVPPALRQLITGVYVEGIVEREGSGSSRGQSQEPSTQAGVLLELYFPHQLFSTGQWGPGTTWSLDWGWQL
ncbi:MAG TPA: translocation/assembly module TamB domain-containing protein, partial [Polyangiaceae bacterium]|nr:translocation/assembly module TamB domain-containing protein [Polyangiaceae bacterium]